MDSEKEIYVGNKKYVIKDSALVKQCSGPNYNFGFYKKNGFFARWGRYKSHNPSYSPIGGEILDIEVTTICDGGCEWCYKSNTTNGKNMSFETFKSIINRMGPQLTQIAIGADSHATSNPDIIRMAKYTRSIGVIPNITVSSINEDMAKQLAEVMGAVSVSNYDKDTCYRSIELLRKYNLNQINMHFLLAEEQYDRCFSTLEDIKNRVIPSLNAIIFMSLKKKGRGERLTPLEYKKYRKIVQYCLKNNIRFGFDSCGAKRFMDCVENHPQYKSFCMVVEPCEAACFSQYINVDNYFFPCSFMEGESQWGRGIDVLSCDDYLNDVWYYSRTVEFRNLLIKNNRNKHKCRECPMFSI